MRVYLFVRSTQYVHAQKTAVTLLKLDESSKVKVKAAELISALLSLAKSLKLPAEGGRGERKQRQQQRERERLGSGAAADREGNGDGGAGALLPGSDPSVGLSDLVENHILKPLKTWKTTELTAGVRGALLSLLGQCAELFPDEFVQPGRGWVKDSAAILVGALQKQVDGRETSIVLTAGTLSGLDSFLHRFSEHILGPSAVGGKERGTALYSQIAILAGASQDETSRYAAQIAALKLLSHHASLFITQLSADVSAAAAADSSGRSVGGKKVKVLAEPVKKEGGGSLSVELSAAGEAVRKGIIGKLAEAAVSKNQSLSSAARSALDEVLLRIAASQVSARIQTKREEGGCKEGGVLPGTQKEGKKRKAAAAFGKGEGSAGYDEDKSEAVLSALADFFENRLLSAALKIHARSSNRSAASASSSASVAVTYGERDTAEALMSARSLGILSAALVTTQGPFIVSQHLALLLEVLEGSQESAIDTAALHVTGLVKALALMIRSAHRAVPGPLLARAARGVLPLFENYRGAFSWRRRDFAEALLAFLAALLRVARSARDAALPVADGPSEMGFDIQGASVRGGGDLGTLLGQGDDALGDEALALLDEDVGGVGRESAASLALRAEEWIDGLVQTGLVFTILDGRDNRGDALQADRDRDNVGGGLSSLRILWRDFFLNSASRDIVSACVLESGARRPVSVEEEEEEKEGEGQEGTGDVGDSSPFAETERFSWNEDPSPVEAAAETWEGLGRAVSASASSSATRGGRGDGQASAVQPETSGEETLDRHGSAEYRHASVEVSEVQERVAESLARSALGLFRQGLSNDLLLRRQREERRRQFQMELAGGESHRSRASLLLTFSSLSSLDSNSQSQSQQSQRSGGSADSQAAAAAAGVREAGGATHGMRLATFDLAFLSEQTEVNGALVSHLGQLLEVVFGESRKVGFLAPWLDAFLRVAADALSGSGGEPPPSGLFVMMRLMLMAHAQADRKRAGSEQKDQLTFKQRQPTLWRRLRRFLSRVAGDLSQYEEDRIYEALREAAQAAAACQRSTLPLLFQILNAPAGGSGSLEGGQAGGAGLTGRDLRRARRRLRREKAQRGRAVVQVVGDGQGESDDVLEEDEDELAEDSREVLCRRVIRYLGSLGGRAAAFAEASIQTASLAKSKKSALDRDGPAGPGFPFARGMQGGAGGAGRHRHPQFEEVAFEIPFKGSVCQINVGAVVDRVSEVALKSPDRQLRSSATEFLHAVTQFFIGQISGGARTEERKEAVVALFRDIFPVLLGVGSSADPLPQQILRPLLLQLSRWTASEKGKAVSEAVTDCLIEKLGDKTSKTLRELAGQCLAEFLKYVCKQRALRVSSLESQLQKLFDALDHPDPFRRMGGAATLQAFMPTMQADAEIVNLFALKSLCHVLSALRASRQTGRSPGQGCESVGGRGNGAGGGSGGSQASQQSGSGAVDLANVLVALIGRHRRSLSKGLGEIQFDRLVEVPKERPSVKDLQTLLQILWREALLSSCPASRDFSRHAVLLLCDGREADGRRQVQAQPLHGKRERGGTGAQAGGTSRAEWARLTLEAEEDHSHTERQNLLSSLACLQSVSCSSSHSPGDEKEREVVEEAIERACSAFAVVCRILDSVVWLQEMGVLSCEDIETLPLGKEVAKVVEALRGEECVFVWTSESGKGVSEIDQQQTQLSEVLEHDEIRKRGAEMVTLLGRVLSLSADGKGKGCMDLDSLLGGSGGQKAKGKESASHTLFTFPLSHRNGVERRDVLEACGGALKRVERSLHGGRERVNDALTLWLNEREEFDLKRRAALRTGLATDSSETADVLFFESLQRDGFDVLGGGAGRSRGEGERSDLEQLRFRESRANGAGAVGSELRDFRDSGGSSDPTETVERLECYLDLLEVLHEVSLFPLGTPGGTQVTEEGGEVSFNFFVQDSLECLRKMNASTAGGRRMGSRRGGQRRMTSSSSASSIQQDIFCHALCRFLALAVKSRDASDETEKEEPVRVLFALAGVPRRKLSSDLLQKLGSLLLQRLSDVCGACVRSVSQTVPGGTWGGPTDWVPSLWECFGIFDVFLECLKRVSSTKDGERGPEDEEGDTEDDSGGQEEAEDERLEVARGLCTAVKALHPLVDRLKAFNEKDASKAGMRQHKAATALVLRLVALISNASRLRFFLAFLGESREGLDCLKGVNEMYATLMEAPKLNSRQRAFVLRSLAPLPFRVWNVLLDGGDGSIWGGGEAAENGSKRARGGGGRSTGSRQGRRGRVDAREGGAGVAVALRASLEQTHNIVAEQFPIKSTDPWGSQADADAFRQLLGAVLEALVQCVDVPPGGLRESTGAGGSATEERLPKGEKEPPSSLLECLWSTLRESAHAERLTVDRHVARFLQRAARSSEVARKVFNDTFKAFNDTGTDNRAQENLRVALGEKVLLPLAWELEPSDLVHCWASQWKELQKYVLQAASARNTLSISALGGVREAVDSTSVKLECIATALGFLELCHCRLPSERIRQEVTTKLYGSPGPQLMKELFPALMKVVGKKGIQTLSEVGWESLSKSVTQGFFTRAFGCLCAMISATQSKAALYSDGLFGAPPWALCLGEFDEKRFSFRASASFPRQIRSGYSLQYYGTASVAALFPNDHLNSVTQTRRQGVNANSRLGGVLAAGVGGSSLSLSLSQSVGSSEGGGGRGWMGGSGSIGGSLGGEGGSLSLGGDGGGAGTTLEGLSNVTPSRSGGGRRGSGGRRSRAMGRGNPFLDAARETALGTLKSTLQVLGEEPSSFTISASQAFTEGQGEAQGGDRLARARAAAAVSGSVVLSQLVTAGAGGTLTGTSDGDARGWAGWGEWLHGGEGDSDGDSVSTTLQLQGRLLGRAVERSDDGRIVWRGDWLDADAINSEPLLPVLLRTLDVMHLRFGEQWEQQGTTEDRQKGRLPLPDYLRQWMHQAMHVEGSFLIRLLLLRIICLRPQYFAPFADGIFPFLSETCTHRSFGVRDEIHFVFRDALQTVLEFNNYVPSPRCHDSASAVFNLLVRNATHPDSYLRKIHVQIVRLLAERWRSFLVPDRPTLVRMLRVMPDRAKRMTEKDAGAFRQVGLLVCAALIEFAGLDPTSPSGGRVGADGDVSMSDDTAAMDAEGTEFLNALVGNLTFGDRKVSALCAEVCGLLLCRHPNADLDAKCVEAMGKIVKAEVSDSSGDRMRTPRAAKLLDCLASHYPLLLVGPDEDGSGCGAWRRLFQRAVGLLLNRSTHSKEERVCLLSTLQDVCSVGISSVSVGRPESSEALTDSLEKCFAKLPRLTRETALKSLFDSRGQRDDVITSMRSKWAILFDDSDSQVQRAASMLLLSLLPTMSADDMESALPPLFRTMSSHTDPQCRAAFLDCCVWLFRFSPLEQLRTELKPHLTRFPFRSDLEGTDAALSSLLLPVVLERLEKFWTQSAGDATGLPNSFVPRIIALFSTFFCSASEDVFVQSAAHLLLAKTEKGDRYDDPYVDTPLGEAGAAGRGERELMVDPSALHLGGGGISSGGRRVLQLRDSMATVGMEGGDSASGDLILQTLAGTLGGGAATLQSIRQNDEEAMREEDAADEEQQAQMNQQQGGRGASGLLSTLRVVSGPLSSYAAPFGAETLSLGFGSPGDAGAGGGVPPGSQGVRRGPPTGFASSAAPRRVRMQMRGGEDAAGGGREEGAKQEGADLDPKLRARFRAMRMAERKGGAAAQRIAESRGEGLGTRRVRLARKYRVGELPDVRVTRRDLLEPLIACCGDAGVAVEVMLAVSTDVYLHRCSVQEKKEFSWSAVEALVTSCGPGEARGGEAALALLGSANRGKKLRSAADTLAVSFLHRLLLSLPEVLAERRLRVRENEKRAKEEGLEETGFSLPADQQDVVDCRAVHHTATASMNWLSGALLLEQMLTALLAPPPHVRGARGGASRRGDANAGGAPSVTVAPLLAHLHELMELLKEDSLQRGCAHLLCVASLDEEEDQADFRTSEQHRALLLLSRSAGGSRRETLEVKKVLEGVVAVKASDEDADMLGGDEKEEGGPEKQWQQHIFSESLLQVLDQMSRWESVCTAARLDDFAAASAGDSGLSSSTEGGGVRLSDLGMTIVGRSALGLEVHSQWEGPKLLEDMEDVDVPEERLEEVLDGLVRSLEKGGTRDPSRGGGGGAGTVSTGAAAVRLHFFGGIHSLLQGQTDAAKLLLLKGQQMFLTGWRQLPPLAISSRRSLLSSLPLLLELHASVKRGRLSTSAVPNSESNSATNPLPTDVDFQTTVDLSLARLAGMLREGGSSTDKAVAAERMQRAGQWWRAAGDSALRCRNAAGAEAMVNRMREFQKNRLGLRELELVVRMKMCEFTAQHEAEKCERIVQYVKGELRRREKEAEGGKKNTEIAELELIVVGCRHAALSILMDRVRSPLVNLGEEGQGQEVGGLQAASKFVENWPGVWKEAVGLQAKRGQFPDQGWQLRMGMEMASLSDFLLAALKEAQVREASRESGVKKERGRSGREVPEASENPGTMELRIAFCRAVVEGLGRAPASAFAVRRKQGHQRNRGTKADALQTALVCEKTMHERLPKVFEIVASACASSEENAKKEERDRLVRTLRGLLPSVPSWLFLRWLNQMLSWIAFETPDGSADASSFSSLFSPVVDTLVSKYPQGLAFPLLLASKTSPESDALSSHADRLRSLCPLLGSFAAAVEVVTSPDVRVRTVFREAFEAAFAEKTGGPERLRSALRPIWNTFWADLVEPEAFHELGTKVGYMTTRFAREVSKVCEDKLTRRSSENWRGGRGGSSSSSSSSAGSAVSPAWRDACLEKVVKLGTYDNFKKGFLAELEKRDFLQKTQQGVDETKLEHICVWLRDLDTFLLQQSDEEAEAIAEGGQDWVKGVQRSSGSVGSRGGGIPESFLEVPGQYKGIREPQAHLHVKVVRVQKKVKVMRSKQRPKKIDLLGDDEKEHPFLMKGGDDLRLDLRIEQLLGVVNDLVADRSSSSSSLFYQAAAAEDGLAQTPGAFGEGPAISRLPAVCTYEVIATAPQYGFLEWVDGTLPLKALVESALPLSCFTHESGGAVSSRVLMSTKACDAYRKGLTSAGPAWEAVMKADRKASLERYRRAAAELPCFCLARRMWQCAISPEAFWVLRSNFASSLGAFSAVGYVLGIGDRHLENFLVSTSTFNLVPIDFGYSFGQGVRLPIPELVPFRLSQNLVGAFPAVERAQIDSLHGGGESVSSAPLRLPSLTSRLGPAGESQRGIGGLLSASLSSEGDSPSGFGSQLSFLGGAEGGDGSQTEIEQTGTEGLAVSGPFSDRLCSVMAAMREQAHRGILLSICTVFMNEPLVDWEKEATRKFNRGKLALRQDEVGGHEDDEEATVAMDAGRGGGASKEKEKASGWGVSSSKGQSGPSSMLSTAAKRISAVRLRVMERKLMGDSPEDILMEELEDSDIPFATRLPSVPQFRELLRVATEISQRAGAGGEASQSQRPQASASSVRASGRGSQRQDRNRQEELRALSPAEQALTLLKLASDPAVLGRAWTGWTSFA
uniref:PI3K/PI4K catalytic domain-containing protein n=1 Tax=Chromera velia CCMP2878 TaxID=1169474 RepID=A0A0G4HZ01_9ALVE|eukprot:Cvel_9618.t1-p1 / transcript=Cvel_9618.t1 / gene=Cvel_9618 / organism=Chromera_velia_CCMP2878 / gene_product=DNA-dependent protein kinase catalytic subunit, putative / transcript_product=DNA-dependent protein kinase catalytic subunit, putative / location=Cvel_scaffold559:9272-41178(-) / protein_length=5507 / sequence_SO=supercontig / SO=protein_coding / is_pseudo=false